MLLLGYDIGSSSIKASLLDAATGKILARAGSPQTELRIEAERPGWAEQHPQLWWDNVKAATAEIKSKAARALADVRAIGISYQMHGLVLVAKNLDVLRPAIIWCDSRAVQIGQEAAEAIGQSTCLKHLLNSPGNFTASKLKWVMQNEPDIYAKIHKAMLPGDYIAARMTGQIATTASGLSEGILWDFQNKNLADIVLDHYGISGQLIPPVVPTFSVQGQLTPQAAEELGLRPGVAITYRAGDQPNNALSLNVLNPGEIAATAGTSGVIYGVADEPNYDPQSRVNIFAHVNYSPEDPRYGVLLCVNGTGILNSWLKHNATGGLDYERINALAAQAPVGCDDLTVLPYGNGAERTLGNRDLGSVIHGLKFSRHDQSHLLRAAQEGIAFALNYGLQIMRDMNIRVKTVRAGHANMFLSPLFGQAFAGITGAAVELFETDGSEGAARGAGLGAGIYKDFEEAFTRLRRIKTIEPDGGLGPAYKQAYNRWVEVLGHELEKSEN